MLLSFQSFNSAELILLLQKFARSRPPVSVAAPPTLRNEDEGRKKELNVKRFLKKRKRKKDLSTVCESAHTPRVGGKKAFFTSFQFLNGGVLPPPCGKDDVLSTA